ncbi:MAG: pyruvate, phosphate dikinase [Acidimicrobiia bacterium]
MYVFDFSAADGSDKDLLGGKGAGLATMTSIGLPVPPGFTLSTDACRQYLAKGEVPGALWHEVAEAVERLEKATGRFLGEGAGTPLLLSVRSGAKFSMPGMMDTVLNLGLNDQLVTALGSWAGGDHFAWDAYRRLIQTYGKVVLGVDETRFEQILGELRAGRGVQDDASLTAQDLEQATRRFQQVVSEAGEEIPEDPTEQLHSAITSVFSSWTNRRAREYRRLNDIPDDLGTACSVQMMVFGDLGDDSGTGVCFTRDPATGEEVPYGDYLPNAQGEDVVAGIRNTLPLEDLADRHPEHHRHLLEVMHTLERHYADMCDIEFTIEREQLWILQTRVGKRTAQAAVRIAVEMADEGMIDRETALLRVDPTTLETMLHPRLADGIDVEPVTTGLDASPGAACGVAVFSADRAVEVAATGVEVVLVRWETNPDDIHGMAAAKGILTSHGGKTSHAAVVARGMGKAAVTGAAALEVDEAAGSFVVGDVTVSEGDIITIDGGTGRVFLGPLPLVDPEPSTELEVLLGWADDVRRLGIRANADDADGAAVARKWGAEGIGLARTEHMFMGDRLPVVRSIILEKETDQALDELAQIQADDFTELLEAMDGLPVIIRLLDPPLHEFLPSRLELLLERRDRSGDTDDLDRMIEAVTWLEETNPMMGLRGVRLGVMRPELYRTQVRAAMEAVKRRLAAGGDPRLEIMIPLVSHPTELKLTAAMVREEIEASGVTIDVPVGTMIEIPRAALQAGALARHADFFSFGTNDLTQMTYGMSRDDAERAFLDTYVANGILPANPFAHVDEEGVGRLVAIATREGKEADPTLEVGVCGEHGGDPQSIAFFHRVGLDYVSCSPPRVPIARLAAAHAALGEVADRSTV